mmetsp:Transcript_11039/g.30996  ORF Transcript_11039/g.30996 Transcript_11039/m.30996 type:complete len:219 (-) Transcript_11039:141-797(-)
MLSGVESPLNDFLKRWSYAGVIITGITLDLVTWHAFGLFEVGHVFVHNQHLPNIAAFVIRGMIVRLVDFDRTGKVAQPGRIRHAVAPEGPQRRLVRQGGAVHPLQVEDGGRRCPAPAVVPGGSRHGRKGRPQRRLRLLGLHPRLGPGSIVFGCHRLVQGGHLIPEGRSEGRHQNAQDQRPVFCMGSVVVVMSVSAGHLSCVVREFCCLPIGNRDPYCM